jgi:hypothetical protein
MAKRFYLYKRERKGKPAIWYVRFRSQDGTIGSPTPTGLSDPQAAEQRAVERLLDGTSADGRCLLGTE